MAAARLFGLIVRVVVLLLPKRRVARDSERTQLLETRRGPAAAAAIAAVARATAAAIFTNPFMDSGRRDAADEAGEGAE